MRCNETLQIDREKKSHVSLKKRVYLYREGFLSVRRNSRTLFDFNNLQNVSKNTFFFKNQKGTDEILEKMEGKYDEIA